MDIAYVVKCMHVLSTFFKLVAYFCKHVFLIVPFVLMCHYSSVELLSMFLQHDNSILSLVSY